MIRIAICLLAASCVNASKADAPAQPTRNLVCERVAIADPAAQCTPELSTDAIHRARVKQGDIAVACALPAGALTVVCGPLIAVEPRPAPTESK